MPCVFCVCLQGVPGFLRHSRQTSLGVCEILVLGNPLLKSGRCLGRLSSSLLDHLNGVPLRLIGCRYHWWRLASCWPVSIWRHPVSLALFAMWSPCRLNAQVQFADNKPVICPAVCTTYSLCHSDILLSYYDIINEVSVFGAMMQRWRLVAS